MKLTAEEKQEILQRRQKERIPLFGARHEYFYAPVHLIRDVTPAREQAKAQEQGREVSKGNGYAPNYPAPEHKREPEKTATPAPSKEKGELSKSANGAIQHGVLYEGNYAVPVKNYQHYYDLQQQQRTMPQQPARTKGKEPAMEM